MHLQIISVCLRPKNSSDPKFLRKCIDRQLEAVSSGAKNVFVFAPPDSFNWSSEEKAGEISQAILHWPAHGCNVSFCLLFKYMHAWRKAFLFWYSSLQAVICDMANIL